MLLAAMTLFYLVSYWNNTNGRITNQSHKQSQVLISYLILIRFVEERIEIQSTQIIMQSVSESTGCDTQCIWTQNRFRFKIS